MARIGRIPPDILRAADRRIEEATGAQLRRCVGNRRRIERRLRQLDEKLTKSELYAIRGKDFSYWSGDRGPVLQGFGVADGPGLQQYLALQFSRAETLVRQAQPL